MFKRYKLKNHGLDIEPHEIFLDTLAHQKEEELGLTEKKFEVPLREKIPYFLMGIFLLLALPLLSKTFYLQAFEGKQLYTAAENNKGSATLVIPERGIVYDKNLKKLVSNSPAYDLVCQKQYFSESSDIVAQKVKDIANITGKTPDELNSQIQNTDSSEIIISENISHENILMLEAKINELQGCKIQQNVARNYLYGSVFSEILGYTGRINKQEYSNSSGYSISDYIGKTGLEEYYETYLRGTPGQLKSVKDAKGVSQGSELILNPEPGYNLVLNIDADLQQELYNSLENRLKDIGGKKGAAVAMDPRTGAVLALVSYPSYDANLFSKGISVDDYNKIQNDPLQPLFNRAISAQYPTGSTIKPFEAAAALQEKLISPDKEINDIGYILVHNQYDPSITYKYSGVTPHGWVDMRKALAVSSNIYFYTVGGGYENQQGLGPTRIKKYLSLFGWGAKTGIDLPGDFQGFIPDPQWKKRVKNESWWDGDTYNLAIGQSDLMVSPLQVASAYCVIANNGTLYQPQIVNKITGPLENSIQPIKQFEPEIIRKDFIDAENLQIVREGMRDGVTQTYGLSKSLNDLPVAVAAKTGTAEIGYKDRFNVWSSVFAPYENPEIVLVVTAEDVQGLGAVTLPVAHDVLNWYFSR